jgi:hypothetical protein
MPSDKKERPSPFKTGAELFHEDKGISENRKRLMRWADSMVMDRKISPDWKEDPEAVGKVEWLMGKKEEAPSPKPEKSVKVRKKGA